MPATPAWLAALEALLDRGIRTSARATVLAGRLEGTVLRLEISGLIVIRASMGGGRLALMVPDESREGTSPGRSADATISGSPAALLRLARGDANRDSAGTAAQVRGDAQIALLYRQLFSFGRPDLEEELARVVGDLPARRLSRLAVRAVAWGRKGRRVAGENIAEYLQEESRDLVTKPELGEFLRGVDTLRETTDRVAARLSILERRLKGSP